jgi:hypothetical protein
VENKSVHLEYPFRHPLRHPLQSAARGIFHFAPLTTLASVTSKKFIKIKQDWCRPSILAVHSRFLRPQWQFLKRLYNISTKYSWLVYMKSLLSVLLNIYWETSDISMRWEGEGDCAVIMLPTNTWYLHVLFFQGHKDPILYSLLQVTPLPTNRDTIIHPLLGSYIKKSRYDYSSIIR